MACLYSGGAQCWWGKVTNTCEREHHEGNESGDGVGFFYEEDGGEAQEEEDAGIGARVAARRQGRLHNGGGQME